MDEALKCPECKREVQPIGIAIVGMEGKNGEIEWQPARSRRLCPHCDTMLVRKEGADPLWRRVA